MGLTSPDMENTSDQQNLIAFRLHQQTYALPIEPIVQIVEMVTTTPIPQVSHSVEGVINVRGMTVPVVNLRRHLGLPEKALQLHTPILLVETDEWLVGLIVDEVTDVLNLPTEQIARPADILPEGLGEAPVLKGLAHTESGAILLLDLEHLFLPDQAHVLAQVAATPIEALVMSEESPADIQTKGRSKDAPERPSPETKAQPARKRRKKKGRKKSEEPPPIKAAQEVET